VARHEVDVAFVDAAILNTLSVIYGRIPPRTQKATTEWEQLPPPHRCQIQQKLGTAGIQLDTKGHTHFPMTLATRVLTRAEILVLLQIAGIETNPGPEGAQEVERQVDSQENEATQAQLDNNAQASLNDKRPEESAGQQPLPACQPEQSHEHHGQIPCSGSAQLPMQITIPAPLMHMALTATEPAHGKNHHVYFIAYAERSQLQRAHQCGLRTVTITSLLLPEQQPITG